MSLDVSVELIIGVPYQKLGNSQVTDFLYKHFGYTEDLQRAIHIDYKIGEQNVI